MTSDAYNTLTNRLTSGNFAYDTAGNETTISPFTVTYDVENRQTGFSSISNGTATYTYDGDGGRVTKTAGGVTTTYVYDAKGDLTSEYSTQPPPPPCLTCYITTDHLGSTRVVTDENAAVTARHDFLPFGEELTTSNRTAALGYGAYDNVMHKYTGQERDTEGPGLDFFHARYFHGAQGRFTSVDPFTVTPGRLVDPQQLDLYAYVRNSPLRNYDPTGMVIDTSQLSDKDKKKWQGVEDIANQKDGDGNYVHPELHKILDTLQKDPRTFVILDSKLDLRAAGLFTITNYRADGKDFTRATLQLDFNKIRNISAASDASLVPGFKEFQGLLNAPLDRLAETAGHEGAHGVFAINDPAQAVRIQQLVDETTAAAKVTRYP